jgi:hypothetical protein
MPFTGSFDRVVELCIEAGLVQGEELYLDATKVQADASMDSLRPRLSQVTAREHVERLFAASDSSAAQASKGDGACGTANEDAPTHNDAPQASFSGFRQLMESYGHAHRSPSHEKASYGQGAHG